ncbi:hypothetical protein DERP_009938 [Dermatophagoides pteronyssinus]|uniref:Uncharacterized protein n=1 Tax=Dermatophagoides pteronyssinus TaxID=6956 RepID=A0ABQ8J228_DERPT|nr:hypothetical protein DERP_009938 [Dermatophagoides pteronyssinus]
MFDLSKSSILNTPVTIFHWDNQIKHLKLIEFVQSPETKTKSPCCRTLRINFFVDSSVDFFESRTNSNVIGSTFII